MKIDFNNAWRQVQKLANDIVTLLPNILLAALVLLIAYVIAKQAARLVRSLTQRAGQAASVGLLLGRTATYVVMTFGGLVALSTVFPSFTANSLIQTLGIGGVAVGFAFKDIFQNFLAGVIILISRPFRLGDTIAVKGYEGTVEDIQTRATMIRTFDNKRIVIPNSVVFTEVVKVNTAYHAQRTELEFSIAYRSDVEAAKAAILGVMTAAEGVEATPAPDVLAMNLTDSGVVLRMRFWTATETNGLAVRDRVVSGVKQALERSGVGFAVQTITVSPPENADASGADASDADVSGERWAHGGREGGQEPTS